MQICTLFLKSTFWDTYPFEDLYLKFTPRMKPVQRVSCLTKAWDVQNLLKRIVSTKMKLHHFLSLMLLQTYMTFFCGAQKEKFWRITSHSFPWNYHSPREDFLALNEQKRTIKVIHMTCMVSQVFRSHILQLWDGLKFKSLLIILSAAAATWLLSQWVELKSQISMIHEQIILWTRS